MKKLSFIFTTLFVVGSIMAQNTAKVTENGNNNTGYVNQSGHSNTAIIDQKGDLNKADVNDQFVSTIAGFGLLTDAKGVTQEGNNNTGTITQLNDFLGVGIAGPIGGLYQKGNKNTAKITQLHNSAYDQEYAWVEQFGDGNKSIQDQENTYAFSSHILQVGASLANSEDILSNVTNNASATQLGGYAQNSSIWQVGVRNSATTYQGNALFVYTHNNLAETTQKGNDNFSVQTQLGSNNIARIVQTGDQNTSNTAQNGDGNIVKISQTGMSNHSQLLQDCGSYADIAQNGSGNFLKGIGWSFQASSLGGSTLDLDQLGSGNTLNLQQTNGASAKVMQNGLTNTSIVIQN